MSWTEGFLVGFDLETTGVDPKNDRIVTACMVGFEGPQALGSRDWLADPGCEIPEAATRVHGISTEHARTHGAPIAAVLEQLLDGFRRVAAAGGVIIGHNVSYDLTALHTELLRHGFPPFLTGDEAPAIVDTLVLDKQFDRYRKGKRTLGTIAEHYGVRLDDAHNASADALAAVEIAVALAQRYPKIAKVSPKELHSMQIGWKQEQAADFQRYLRQSKDPQAVVSGAWPVEV
ncbi:3'-5' exonuclease [Sediminivirga luteola]|uniref:3'-5' exonuclease n=1 Tax=Sediminivirga luteola TaxID=1774748 RepID=A0A8J2U026_9MICO|nr:3'-5' exonuclease [Sediminivirga luteola]MCI2264051.1 3'-5' exonuclease [Sediminivirga luteola]GGA22743.1 3'-5' exonuclease [Sediminivirga luteola]